MSADIPSPYCSAVSIALALRSQPPLVTPRHHTRLKRRRPGGSKSRTTGSTNTAHGPIGRVTRRMRMPWNRPCSAPAVWPSNCGGKAWQWNPLWSDLTASSVLRLGTPE